MTRKQYLRKFTKYASGANTHLVRLSIILLRLQMHNNFFSTVFPLSLCVKQFLAFLSLLSLNLTSMCSTTVGSPRVLPRPYPWKESSSTTITTNTQHDDSPDKLVLSSKRCSSLSTRSWVADFQRTKLSMETLLSLAVAAVWSKLLLDVLPFPPP